jgi:hypothetical protein
MMQRVCGTRVAPVVLTAIIVPELVLPRGELDVSPWATRDCWPA